MEDGKVFLGMVCGAIIFFVVAISVIGHFQNACIELVKDKSALEIRAVCR